MELCEKLSVHSQIMFQRLVFEFTLSPLKGVCETAYVKRSSGCSHIVTRLVYDQLNDHFVKFH